MKPAETNQRKRPGSVLVLTVLMMIVMFAGIAVAVDLGYLCVVRAELQRSADATALATAWTLCDEASLSGDGNPLLATDLARVTAQSYASSNQVAGSGPVLDLDDVTFGYLQEDGETISMNPTPYIATKVNVTPASQGGDSVPLFFAKALGISSSSKSAQATAVFVNGFSGFKAPSSGENLEILPFALDKETWDAICYSAQDDYTATYNEATDEWTVSAGSDGVPEANLFPQGLNAPGNRGTVDIGSANNSNCDIARQILYGVSEADLEYHGGELKLDENGQLLLNGDTGISAGVKDELNAIKGQPRIIPVFSSVSGNGNNAQYTIVEFVGVRIMHVKLTGQMSGKKVVIQPAKVCTQGGIPSSSGTSDYIYSPVWLIH